MHISHHNKKRPGAIYRSRLHIGVTVLLVALPFLFLIVSSRLAHLAAYALLADVGVSFARMLAAYAAAAILGWTCAVLFWRGRLALVALPFFDVLQSFPALSALPVAVAAWGASDATIIFFLAAEIVWPIFFSIVSSLKMVRRDWEEAVAVSGLRGWDYWRQFLIPVSIPGLVTGSIIGLGEGWETLVAIEIIVGLRRGIGEFFAGFAYNPTITAFGIFGFLLFVFSINKLLWLPLLEWSHRMVSE